MGAMENAAMSYCNIKMIVSGIVGILLAISSAVASIYMKNSKDLDTDHFIQTTATTKSVDVRTGEVKTGNYYRTVYKIFVTYEYIVDGKPYLTAEMENGHRDTKEQANSVADTLKNKTTTIYYDPDNHANNTAIKNIEDKGAVGLFVMAICIAIVSVIGIILRKNPIFCGLTVANDAIKLFRN